MEHYQSDTAALMQLAEWFRFLRENDLWDNTRILVVSDHGYEMGLNHILTGGNEGDNALAPYDGVIAYNALMMIKDFGSNSGFTVCNDFMTNADTPVLATAGVISNPVNPFTGKPLSSEAKNGQQTVLYTEEWNPSEKHLYNFPPSPHYAFYGKVPSDADKWKYLGEW